MPRTAQQKNKPAPLDEIKVKVALLHRGWTQGDLANAVGVSITTVNLTIKHNTSANTNRRIRKILGL